ncbi:MAG: hypothetical protein WBL63_20070 [Candidatus Acidiferrum sp.]
MPIIFWIALGLALAGLIIGLILKARLGDEQVWEELIEPNAAADAQHSEVSASADEPEFPNIPVVLDQPSKPHWGIPMTTSPNPRLPREADLRRSSRLERPVPLVVLGTNRRGESFQEKTSAITVNLHGCRYSSRHDFAPEDWVVLQVAGTDGVNSPTLRARVCSVLSPRTSRELCQVGVELETPGNVWGIPAPPEDWQRILGSANSNNGAAAATAPATEPSHQPVSFIDKQHASAERRAEVTVFPGTLAGAEAPLTREPASSNGEQRVVLTSEQLLQVLQALQSSIQSATDQAVQTSVSQLDDAVKIAIGKIEDSWKANLRQTEDFSAARLAEVQNLWEKELVVYRTRAEEVSGRLEALTANSQQGLGETQQFLERFASEIAPQLQGHLTESFGRANSEFEARAAQVSEHYLAQLSQSTQLAARDANSQLNDRVAELQSLLAAANANAGASPERLEELVNSTRKLTLESVEERLGQFYIRSSQQYDLTRERTDQLARQIETLAAESRQARAQQEQSLAELRSLSANTNGSVPQEQLDSQIHSLREQTLSHLEERLSELSDGSEQQHNVARQRTNDIVRQLEALAAETRQTRSQHEQTLAELRSLLANASAGVPQERLDSIVNSSREQILSNIEWRLGEVTGRYEQLLGQANGRADEVAQQLDALSNETRDQLSELKDLAERAVREVQSQDIVAIQQSVARATQEFETAAARVSDRQLVRLMELKQAVSREISLELEARATEARSVLQKTANSTIEEIRRRIETQIEPVLAEATERATSSLASLDAESRAACEARYSSLEGEVARAAEQAAMEFRSGIKAFLYSCLVAAVSAVDQHTQTALAGLAADPESLPGAFNAIAAGSSVQREDPPLRSKEASSSQ